MNADQSILAVEDDAVTRRLVGWVLSQHDFRVLEARNLAEARNWLSTDPDLALVMSDYHLPDGTGLDLLAGLREQGRSRVPFLLVSGTYAPPATVGLEFEFLAKPFTPEQLLAAIGRLLHQPVPPMRFREDIPPPDPNRRVHGGMP
jgi:DNA-binding NtrC family response regulator